MANRTALFSRQQPGGVFTIQDQKEHPASVWWVDSGAAGKGDTVGHGQNPDLPFSTFAYAYSSALMAVGDMLYLQPGHAETIAAAGGIAANIAGITVQGLGVGASKPTLTFSDTASSVLITGASTKIKGVRIVPSVDSVTNPFHVQAADCELEYEVLESDNAIEFVRSLLTTAAGDRLKADIKYIGRTGGDACVNAVRLVGCDGAEINIDFYGKASTAVVEFLTTACTNVKVNGRSYNSGTTDGSKNVVDTVTGSTWDAVIWDATAGLQFSGSSGKALSADLKEFIVKKTLTSSAVVQAGVDVTGLATGGDILIEDVIFQSNATGLVTGTNFQLKKSGGNGLLTVFEETIANIGGANKSESLGSGSVVAGDAFVLDSGRKLTANSTVADCTGAGTIDIYLVCRRVAAGATLAAA